MAFARNVLTVGGYTMVSRVLGFIRDMMIAWALGAGPISDVFFVALRLPNLFRTLFAEGAFSAAFVPVFAGKLASDGHDGAKRYAEEALALLLSALLAMVFLGELLMPALIPLLAFGFEGSPDRLVLATGLTRITFPYLLFISLVSLQGVILNSMNRFAATAATPVLLNVFQIGAVIWGVYFGGTVEVLCWAVTAAGVAQFLWLMASCARVGMALELRWPRLTPEMRRLLKLMVPGVFGAGVTQINLLVSTNVASLLPAGSISYLQYADRLNQLPLAVIGIAVGTAILPVVSRQLRAGDDAGANETQNRGLELALLFTLPAATALFMIAEPILAVLFERGRFDAHAAHETALALAVYAAGLPAFVAVKVLAPGFFARHDTRTPVKIAVVALVTNLVLTLVLARPLLHVGNATATTVSGWINATLLLLALQRQGHLTLDRRLLARVPRIVAATLGMALALYLANGLLRDWLAADAPATRALTLAALIGVGLVSYAALAVVTGAVDRAILRARRLGRA